jgi:hypothetical protein
VLDDGIRRLEVQARDLDFLSGLPLKFLVLIGPSPHLKPLQRDGVKSMRPRASAAFSYSA